MCAMHSFPTSFSLVIVGELNFILFPGIPGTVLPVRLFVMGLVVAPVRLFVFGLSEKGGINGAAGRQIYVEGKDVHS